VLLATVMTSMTAFGVALLYAGFGVGRVTSLLRINRNGLSLATSYMSSTCIYFHWSTLSLAEIVVLLGALLASTVHLAKCYEGDMLAAATASAAMDIAGIEYTDEPEERPSTEHSDFETKDESE
jgi:hypothetical protein